MRSYIDSRPDKDQPPRFEPPGNIVFVNVDKSTGATLPAESQSGIGEAFIAGTQPGASSFPGRPAA